MAFSWSAFGKLLAILSDTPAAGAASIQEDVTSNVQGGGFSLGNFGGWSTSAAKFTVLNAARRGISQLYGGVLNKHSVGDCAALYVYNRTDGGATAASDEGATAITAQCSENADFFHGTVASTTGTGDIAPVLTHTTGNNWTTDGAFLLNISKGTIAGNLNGASSALSLTINSGTVVTFLNKLPVTGVSLPISTAIGIATAAIANPVTTRNVPIAVTITVNLAQIGGIFHLFTNGSVVSVAGNQYPEQSIVSGASGLLAGNQQTFTLHLCNPNAQAIIFQGGIQGQYISFDANIIFSGLTSSYYAFGSLLGSDLIYALQAGGTVVNNFLPQAGLEAATTSGPNSGFHLYPGAEIAANTDQGIACTLEQNGVAWAVSDVVQNPHYPVFGGITAFFVREQFTPSTPGGAVIGLQMNMHGPGIGGPGSVAIEALNNNPGTNYSGSGGPLIAPTGLSLNGPFGHLIYCGGAPDASNNAVLFVQNNNTAASNTVNVIILDWAGGGNMTFDVAAGRWHVDRMDASVFSVGGTSGINATITTAKLTTGGANGSMTFAAGILVAQTPAT